MGSWIRRCVAAAAVFIACGVAHGQIAQQDAAMREVQVASDKFDKGVPIPTWVDPLAAMPTTQAADPVVLLGWDTQFLAGDAPSVYSHRAMLLQSASVLESAGRIAIEFNPAYQRVKLHLVRVTRGGVASDRLPTAKISFLQRENGLEQGMYSGSVTVSLVVEDVRVGDVLEYAYSIDGQNPVFAGKFVGWANWDTVGRVEMRRITLWSPPARQIRWRMHGDDAVAVDPVESVERGLRKVRWEGKPAHVDVEPALPSDYMPVRFLVLSEFADWAEVATWADALFTITPSNPRALLERAAEFKKTSDPQERASLALRWVQENVRYMSLSFGESSHRPAPPEVTLERRYGDCKDKSVLLVWLLKELGIEARPVLVAARAPRVPPRELASPYAFDHVIVAALIDGKTWFLDPTRRGQGARLDTMGQLWEGAQVLVVAKGNGRFTTVAADNRIARNDLEEKFVIPSFDAPAELSVKYTWTGVLAEVRRLGLTETRKDDIRKSFARSYEQRYPGIVMKDGPTIDDDLVANRLELRMTFTGKDMLVKSERGWFLRYQLSNYAGLLPPLPSATRKQPLAIPYAYASSRYSVEAQFPPEVAATEDPRTRHFHDDAFDVSVNQSFRGNRAVATWEANFTAVKVEPDRLAAFGETVRKFFDERAGFGVGKGDLKTAGASGGSPMKYRDTMEKRLNTGVETVTKNIAGGKLTGDDLAEAHCLRADMLSSLGRLDEAMKDAQTALRLAPTIAQPYRCRASVSLATGDFKAAIADYTKAITLDPQELRVYLDRGRARFHAGQMAAAAEDFRTAAGAGKDEATDMFARLWYVIALKRLGKDPGEAAYKFAASDAHGEWPRPALAMLHGVISVDDMYAAIKDKTGEDREMALTEADFYAAERYLAEGDARKAAENFRRVIKRDIFNFIEFSGAQQELKSLEPK